MNSVGPMTTPGTPERRPLTWRGKLLLLVLSPVMVFGLLETGLRVGGFRYEPWKALLEGRTHNELSQTRIYAPDPTLIWTLRPSTVLDLPPGFPGVKTNSLGLRSRELPGPRRPGELRVLVLGDSVSFCLGLPDGKTWPERMEEALRAAPELAGRTVCVLNGGVPGYSSVQGLRLFDRLRDFDPDVVVFWFGLADAHPMRGLPDSAVSLPTEGWSRKLAILWKVRTFQLVQWAVTGVRGICAEGTRVSRSEFRQGVERLLELDQKGRPRVIFVREPECIGVTLGELQAVVERAEQEGAEIILGPRSLLSWISPDPVGADLIGRRTTCGGRPAIVFQPDRADTSAYLVDVRRDYEMLRERKRVFDEFLSELPKDSLTADDLFGVRPPGRVFGDNCHVTDLGARLAGAALAEEALRRLGLR